MAALLDRSRRGMAAIHGMAPAAKKQVKTFVQILHESKINRPAMNFLVDGSFEYHEDFLNEVIDKLAEGSRRPHIEFYLTNGPALRAGNSPLEGFGLNQSAAQFRLKIHGDKTHKPDVEFQNRFKTRTARLKGPIERIHRAGGQAYVVPMLEDNGTLTNDAFKTMLRLTREALAGTSGVKYGRSTEDKLLTSPEEEVFLERHAELLPRSTGIITNDGQYYTFSGFAELQKRAIGYAVFIAWRESYQGGNGVALKNRNFVMPTGSEIDQYIELFRK